MLEMTGREKCLVETSQKKYQPKKITYHDKERNRKIYRSVDCFDCIGDTDGTGGYLVHGYVNVLYTERKEKKERAQLRKKGGGCASYPWDVHCRNDLCCSESKL